MLASNHGVFGDFTYEEYFKKGLYFHKLCRVQEALAKDDILPSEKRYNKSTERQLETLI